MDSRFSANMLIPLQMENHQPLDFTASPMSCDGRETKLEIDAEVEPPVLDLSCKRYSERSTVLHPPSDEKINSEHYVDSDERKSPFEGRSYMVTPPSESDSPRKIKYEPIYNQINSTTSDLSMPHYPMAGLPMPASISGPNSVPASLPNLVASQGYQILQNHSAAMAQIQSPDHHRVGVVSTPSQSPEMAKKVPRPFKAYPKDPLSLTMGSTELICDQTSNEAYSEFRKRMLDSVKKTNEGTNIKMRRTKSPGLPTSTMDDKDAAYWERRRKNNEAAKRSRDARRAKEDEIAIRAAFLEQENIKLKYELVALRNETAKLRCMVYSN